MCSVCIVVGSNADMLIMMKEACRIRGKQYIQGGVGIMVLWSGHGGVGL